MNTGRLRQQVGWDTFTDTLFTNAGHTEAMLWLARQSDALERIREERSAKAEAQEKVL